MKETDSSKIIYSGKSIAKNTIFNLLGYGVPLIIALIIFPLLISGLGEERFGILNLIWGVLGYFSLFDLGIGRAQTKIISEKIGTNKTDEIPDIFWTSFFLMLLISIVGGLIVYFFSHTLVYKIFNITTSLRLETLNTFYLLALSIPIVTTTAGVRGILEAYQKFGVINVIRILLGISSFVVPLICLLFTKSLFWIVVCLIVVRLVILILYISQCFRINKKLSKQLSFKYVLIKPILRLGGWMSVSNITVPMIVYLDRFMIGALVSATAIAYYATPYEAITKLLLIPGALVSVLFPAVSANYLVNPEYTKKLSLRAVKYIFILLFPIVFLIVTFAHQGMSIWLGANFADKSTLVLQLLAVGVLINSIGYIPFNFLEGIGRPDITAKLQLCELPVYFLIMYLVIKYFGINGAALVWLLRVIIDSLILFFFVNRKISYHLEFQPKTEHLLLFGILILSCLPILLSNIILKIILTLILLSGFIYIVWKYYISIEERNFLLTKLKLFNSD
ncbi:MAG: flippase [Ignavibacteriales bacterium]|nr:MAG: flippase [Ignavibacteriales bacterium]